jgi:hypothetical protein
MSPTRFSIRNPLVGSGIAVALCLFGLFAFTNLGVAIAPNVNIPQAVVTTTYPGADPATIEANVTRPIEDAIATLPNMPIPGGRPLQVPGWSRHRGPTGSHRGGCARITGRNRVDCVVHQLGEGGAVL